MTETKTFTVDDTLHGKRLDAALATFDQDNSRSVLRTFIEDGKVSVDGQEVTKPSFKVSVGQQISFEVNQTQQSEDLPQDLPLDIVYEDDDLIVINKPAGLVVHPGAGVKDGTVLNAVLFHFPQSRLLPRAGIVHRLDKETSGLMIIALSQTAYLRLSKAISRHDVIREYVAIAEGLITSGGTVEADISRDPYNRTRMAVVPDGMGRQAITHFRVAEQFREHTLVRLRLETGRTHQIRVHMAHINHPLLGDPQYGGRRFRLLKGASLQLAEALRNFKRQALHAALIEFDHPLSGLKLSFSAPIPDDMSKLIELLREDVKINGRDY